MSKKFHYTYLIIEESTKMKYIGARTCNINPSLDLGFKYFSSTTNIEFKTRMKQNPQNYKFIVLQIFESRKDAILFEIKLHERYDVSINEKFYNKAKQTTTGFDTTGNVEVCKKLSDAWVKRKGDPKKVENFCKGQQRRWENNKFRESFCISQQKRWTDESRQKHKEIMEQYYKDNPDKIKSQAESMKKHFEDNPDARITASKSAKKRFEDPEQRRLASEKNKKFFEENPEERKKIGEKSKESMKKVWADPEYRRRREEKKLLKKTFLNEK